MANDLLFISSIILLSKTCAFEFIDSNISLYSIKDFSNKSNFSFKYITSKLFFISSKSQFFKFFILFNIELLRLKNSFKYDLSFVFINVLK